MNLISIDQSLVNSGICIYNIHTEEMIYQNFKTKTKGQERLDEIFRFYESLFRTYKPKMVIRERQAFAAKGMVADLAAPAHFIDLLAYRVGCHSEHISPATHFKFTTGNGRAKKDAVISAIKEKHNITEDIDDNISDAISMMDMARAMLV